MADRFVLFNPKEQGSTISKRFALPPGFIAVVSVFGLEMYKEPEDEDEAQTVQAIVLQKVLMDGLGLPITDKEICDCDVKIIGHDYTEISVEDVLFDCCPVSLTACDNMLVYGIPGLYKFELNDVTAVGKVYLEVVRVHLSEVGYTLGNVIF